MRAAESENLEYKTSLSEEKDAVVSIAAFATAGGGTIVFGLDPSGQPVGVTIGANTLENLANIIKRNTDPPQFPSISEHVQDGKTIIQVEVYKSPEVPVFAYGRPYKRVGRTNQRLSSVEVKRLSVESQGMTWDMLPCAAATEADIAPELVKQYVDDVDHVRGLRFPETLSTHDVLSKLRLLEGDTVTRAAILLFGKDPQGFLPQSALRCARFRGVDNQDFLDMKVFAGSLSSLITEGMLFVERHTSTAVEISGWRPDRVEKGEYPAEAIREALVNAICHRDYADTGNVQVRIFDDRLEVWNPGILPEGWDVGLLRQSHPSKPRNLRIADCLYRVGIIEQWGTGTQRMIRECVENGLPEPEFEESGGFFVVRFSKAVSPVPSDTSGIKERQARALALMARQGSISRSEYAVLNAVTVRTASSDLRDLVDRGMIAPLGKARGRSMRYSAGDG